MDLPRGFYMRRLVFIVCLSGWGIEATLAATPAIKQGPEALLRVTLDRTLAVLKEKELSLAEKEERINKIVTPIFDFDLMSFLTLGKSQWTSMTDQQRSRFTQLFVKHLKDSYRDKLAMYSDQALIYKPAKHEDSRIQIPTELVAEEQTVSILYKMRNNEKKGKGWQLYDIEVQGVSLIKTYRSQFSEVLSKGTVQDLLDKLAEPPKEESTATQPDSANAPAPSDPVDRPGSSADPS